MSDPTDEERLRRIARERERHMPGETAAGRIDPSTLPDDEREELARRASQLDPEDVVEPEELGGEG
jgi:DNA-binding IclR family transcriptional regulator